MEKYPNITELPEGKLVTSQVLNKSLRELRDMGPVLPTGMTEEAQGGGGAQLPTGQYAEMVFKNVTQNQVGFGFVHTHALV